jgi:protein tyrosine phosphatase
VHCSAGVGRTGTFISMYRLNKEIKKQIKDNVKETQFSVFNFVRKLKEMRQNLYLNFIILNIYLL